MLELITTALILTILTINVCEAAFVYDHMELVLQWPPTFCGQANVNCAPSMSTKLNFLIHGLWPSDPTGNSNQNCLSPPDLEVVKKVWEKDRNLRNDLDTYWPTLLAGKTNESFWIHEWKVHGYCTENIIPALDYFREGIRFVKQNPMMMMLQSLRTGGIHPTNNQAYTVANMKALISAKVLMNNNYEVYISCKPANASYVFLHEIHLCIDRKLKTFISCPPSSYKRGCGGPYLQNHLIFPTRAIYRR